MREYTTQMDAAKKGIITREMEIVANKESKNPEEIRSLVAEGKVAIPANINHKSLSPEGVGQGLKTKINVNLGISKDCCDCDRELEKVRTALDMGAEAIMDLSNYGKTAEMRKAIVNMSTAMLGTVPIYDALGYYDKDLKDLTAKEFLEVVEKHGQDGVDFVTIHAGLNREAVETVKRNKRLTNIVSRGGSLLFAWMEINNAENPFFEYYDELLDICAKYDITLSLGDALRPGSINDASDASQIKELRNEIGMLFQGSALFDSETVLGNVMFPLRMFTRDTYAACKKRAEFCLERVNLKGVNDLYPSEISGGMQKRVAIARAIALNPKYLFCDEPNSGLDPKTSILIDELLSDITHEYNITTIINTHDMNSVIGIGENIVFINKGHREWVGNRAKIFTSSNEALNDFVFATRLFKEVKGYMIEEYRKHESADE